jgi:predicted RNase H-like HicB family nuclease
VGSDLEDPLMQTTLEFKLSGTIKRKGQWYLAYCPSLDISTQGRTKAETKKNLKDASELFLISCLERGTFDQALRELGFSPMQGEAPEIGPGEFPFHIPIPLISARGSQCPV